MSDVLSQTMTKKTANDETTFDGISREQVVRYLKAHPDILDETPELISVLTPPSYHSGVNVVDIQRYMVDRLRDHIDELQGQLRDLIFSCRDNLNAQAQIHEAVIHLLACESLEELADVVSEELPRIFAVDAVRICLEVDISPDEIGEYSTIRFVPDGVLTSLFPGESDVLLGADVPLPEEVFDQASNLVASFALARFETIHLEGYGAIAFGVRDADQFQPGQGTELLRFLARILGICMDRVWEDADEYWDDE